MKKVLYMGIASAILFLLLTVPCFAAGNDYNLVPEDVLTWDRYCDNGTLPASAVGSDFVVLNNQGATANVSNTVMSFCFANTIPQGSLVAGRSYSLSFRYPSDAEIIQYGNRTQAQIDAYWSRVWRVYIGIGYFNTDGNFTPLEDCGVSFERADCAKYAGRVNYVTFVCPNYSGKQLVFAVGFIRAGSTSTANTAMYFGRYYALVDYDKQQSIEEYNRLWYGNAEGDYSNPFTTENYDLGAASDTSELASAFDDFEDGLDNLSAPFRITGRLLNDIFGHDSPLAIIGVIVFLVLILAVVFRLFGVT